MKKYHVELTAAERDELLRLSRSGKTSGRQLTRARILLKADEQLADEEIAEAVGTSVATIERIRQRFVEEGLGALSERPRLGARPKLTATGAAHVIAVAWSPAPGGIGIKLRTKACFYRSFLVFSSAFQRLQDIRNRSLAPLGIAISLKNS